ncbi:hypothetical protein ACHAWX_007160 [Stephanocyclus meneghinianus]
MHSMEITPTNQDVINGRGQGLLRHPGNVKYRKLVAANKELYARCPNGDKIEISKGIVAAIRNFQGRFLDKDKAEGKYYEIGDQKAIAKTSQALREGQSKIRQLLHITSDQKQVFQVEQCFAFSVKVLGELYNSQNNFDVLLNNAGDMDTKPPPLPPPKQSRHLREKLVPAPPKEANLNKAPFTMTSSTAVKMALDQFPMAAPLKAHSNANVNMTQQHNNRANDHHNPSAWHDTNRQSGYSNMSLASISSISAIHTISSEQKDESSRPQGSRQTINSLTTFQSHQKLFDAEKRMYDLDYSDESCYQPQTTCLDENSGMSFTSFGEKNSESSTDADDVISLANKSVDDFSLSSATSDMVKLILGLSSEDIPGPYANV